MNKQCMINEARLYIGSALQWAEVGCYKTFLKSYYLAEYFIDRLLNVFDYDFIDENPELADDYARMIALFKNF